MLRNHIFQVSLINVNHLDLSNFKINNNATPSEIKDDSKINHLSG